MASTTNTAGSAFQASPRGIFEIGKNNLTGRADALSLKLRASTLQYRGLLSYTAPNYFGKRNLSLQLTAFADKTRDINTFTSTRYECALGALRRSSALSRHRFPPVSAAHHAAVAHRDSSAGALLRRRGHHAAQLRAQSGRPARPGHRLPGRRPGVAGLQSRASIPDASSAHRVAPERRAVL